jgi:hypothetical protein
MANWHFDPALQNPASSVFASKHRSAMAYLFEEFDCEAYWQALAERVEPHLDDLRALFEIRGCRQTGACN